MRWLLLLLFIPLAGAHGAEAHGPADVVGFLPDGQHLDHIQLVEVELSPGEQGNFTLSFGGLPFKAGWHWLMRADVEGNVSFMVYQGGQFLANHNLGPGSHVRTHQLPSEDTMRLYLRNLDDTNSTVRFYYDQSCECQFKRVPLPNGPVWFNIDATAGQEVRWEWVLQPIQVSPSSETAGLPIPANVDVRARHMIAENDPTGVVYLPQEQSRETLSSGDPACKQGGPWNGCITLDFLAQEDGPQLVWFDIDHDGDASWTYMIRPLVEVGEPEETTPLAWPLAALALLGAAFYRRAT